jgi:translation initiation factor 1A
MPKPNQKGGKNFKKGKKRASDSYGEEPKATESFHRYAQVVKKLGGNILEVNCSDGTTRHGIIPGKMNKRVWMNAGDVILVEVSTELNKNAKIEECFITHKYSNHAANNLKNMNLITFNVTAEESDDNIKFGEDNSKLSDNIYDEMDKLEDENKAESIANKTQKKETLEDKNIKKRVFKETGKLKDQERQQARTKKDDYDAIDFDSI